jgi:hypothetical protein
VSSRWREEGWCEIEIIWHVVGDCLVWVSRPWLTLATIQAFRVFASALILFCVLLVPMLSGAHLALSNDMPPRYLRPLAALRARKN